MSDGKIKVDTAVIMACGTGTRMSPLTFDTPKSFLKARGEVLIERQIRQLKEAGVEEIIVVVGYLKEKFEYLKQKYNVKLVFNDEYKNTNTLTTLYKVSPYINGKSFYICVADIYLTENIFHEYEKYSHFKCIYIDHENDDWECVTNEESEIIKINRHGKPGYCMIGIGFFDAEKGKILLKRCEELYKRAGTEKFYWEETIYEHFDELKKFYLEKIPNGVFNEFDTFEELKAFSKEEDYGSKCLTIVAKAMGVKESDIENIVVDNNSLTNNTFIFNVKTDSKKYIARVPGIGTDEYINRADEKKILEELQEYGVTEKVVYCDENGYKISEYYEDIRKMDINSEEDLKAAISCLKKIHSLDIKISNKSSLEEKIKVYLDLIEKNKIEIPDEIIRKQKEVFEKIEYKNSLNRPVRLCHGDFNPTNVLFTKEGVKIIDFEYAIMSDPLIDIALFGCYTGLDKEKIMRMYDIYENCTIEASVNENEIINKIIYKGLDVENKNKLYEAYIEICAYYGYVWGVVNEKLASADVAEYLANQRKLLGLV